MNLLYPIAQCYTPAFLKMKGLKALFDVTAAAFERKAPVLEGMSYNECLATYARFAETSVASVIDDRRNLDQTSAALRHRAVEVGLRFRNLFGAKTRKEAMAVARLLYRMIGIDFYGTSDGDITVSRCAFDKFYSARTCRVMASFDEGVLAGLLGDGTLEFTARLTEGCPECEAHFEFKGPHDTATR